MQVCDPLGKCGSLGSQPHFHHMTLSILRSVVESQKSLIVTARNDLSSRDATIAHQNRVIAWYGEAMTSMGQVNRRLQVEAEKNLTSLKKLRECNAGLVKMIADLVTASLGSEVESRALFRQILQLAVENPESEVPTPLQPLGDENSDLLKSISLEPNDQTRLHSGDRVSSTVLTSSYASSECIKSPFPVSESNEQGISWARRSTGEKI